MLILIDYMVGGIGVERYGCGGSNGLGDKKGSSPRFFDEQSKCRNESKPNWRGKVLQGLVSIWIYSIPLRNGSALETEIQ